MKKSRSLLLPLIAALAVSSILPASAQDVIYREVFGRSGTGSSVVSVYNWEAYGVNGVDETANTNNAGVSADGPGVGSFSNINSLPAVNSGVTGTTPTNDGRTFFFNNASFLAYTTEYAVDRSIFTINTISWDQRGTGPALSAAVQIGGSWYVSQALPNPNATGVWNTSVLDFGTATWSTLDFTAGSTLAIGSATALPSGNLTAFGFYAASGASGGTRIDGFTITAVPEPSTYGIIFGVGLIALAVARRRAGTRA